MKAERIFFSPPHISTKEIDLVGRAIANGWVAPVGPELDDFEKKLQERFPERSVLALNSGTAALHLAVILAGIKAGDKVLVASFSFVAAANVVLYEQAVPVFLDSESTSWNLDTDLLLAYLERCKGTSSFPKALIVTHIYGRAAEITRIAQICTAYNIILIENAAEAFGSKIQNQNLGSFGDYGILSFNGNKIITTGGGGALLCKNDELYKKGKQLATQSKAQADHYLHYEIGYNYRLSNVLAAVGLAQLSRFDEILASKKHVYEYYANELSALSWIDLSPEVATNHWVFPFLIKEEFLSSITPSTLVKKFDEAKIEVRRFWRPLHTQPLFDSFEKITNGVCEDLFDRGLCLPSGSNLTTQKLDRVLEVLKSIKC